MTQYQNRRIGSNLFIDNNIDEYYSQKNINRISTKISQLLNGVHPEGKKILVPDNIILNVMDGIHEDNLGHVYEMNDNVISIIVNNIRNEFETIEQNNKLSIWNTQYGSGQDANEAGLRSHDHIKLRNKHPQYAIFNMNY